MLTKDTRRAWSRIKPEDRVAILKSTPSRQANYTASVMTIPYEDPDSDDVSPPADRSVNFADAAKGTAKASPAASPSEAAKAAHPGDVRKMMSQPAKGRKGSSGGGSLGTLKPGGIF